MNKKPLYEYISNLSNIIEEFIDEKHLLGYRFTIEERWLKQFDIYYANLEIPAEKLTASILENFCDRNPNESQMTRQKRLNMMRKFAIYLQKNNYTIDIPKVPAKIISYPKHIPYIFTEAEIKSFYTQIDNWNTTSQSRGHRKLMDPIIFRMVYGCGLRIMEVLRLKITDVNLKDNTLYIHDSKNGRNRIVPMAESLTERCRIYIEQMQGLYKTNDYLFPGLSANNHISHTSTYKRFREYLWKSGIIHTGKGPRIHDFRHTFCVHRLKYWVLSGNELTNLVPYLAAYLGHVDFRGTEYYLRLTADLYPELVLILDQAHGYVIPKLGDIYESN